VTDTDRSFITPARARAIRAGLEAELLDAIRAGEQPLEHGRPAEVPPPSPGETAGRPPRACSVCGTSPARQFMNANYCPAHEPRFRRPDPSRDAEALRARRERLLRLR
jgi:hypothetical protein